MVALDVNVKMDIQEMEQHVMVSDFQILLQILHMIYSLFIILSSEILFYDLK